MQPSETLIQRSIVVMPTLKRPEFLALALEKISQTPKAEHLDVRIFVDHTDEARLSEAEFVRDTYLPTAELFHAKKHVKVLSGTWNILNALKEGYESGAEYIFMLEEDVMVKPDFFSWHWAQHETGDCFVSCGRKYRNMPLDFYSNPGTCYSRDKLKFVIAHICPEYFADTEKYVNRVFPNMIGMDGTLDDGLIRKVIRNLKGKVVCAVPPVAMHQGFHYYNRLDGYINKGVTIQEKIQALREMLPRIDSMNKYTYDFESF